MVIECKNDDSSLVSISKLKAGHYIETHEIMA